jgi:hypothetical protein
MRTMSHEIIKHISLQNYSLIGSEPALIKYLWTISTAALPTKIRVDFITNRQTFLNGITYTERYKY